MPVFPLLIYPGVYQRQGYGGYVDRQVIYGNSLEQSPSIHHASRPLPPLLYPINQIKVDPVLIPRDNELEDIIRNAWRSDPAVYSWKVDASAENGFVTLTGEVDSHAKKDLAGTIAKNVKGVTAIENNIDIGYAIHRPDIEIQNEIRARLENDIRVSDALVGVTVDDAAVELSGGRGQSFREKSCLFPELGGWRRLSRYG